MHTQEIQQSPQEVWEALSKVLLPQTRDANYWWWLTGRHLSALVEAAGYSIERQHEVLLFHYHWTLPYLGPVLTAADDDDGWRSLLGLDGSPIEYSWKWNTRSSPPNVRYSMEPIGRFPGSEMDPLNQVALRELLQGLATAMPSMDLAWTNHFLSTLYDHDYTKYMAQELGTTVQISAEFSATDTSLKTYFFPRKLGANGLMPMEQWEASINQLDADNAARAALHEFIAESPEGRLLTPFSVGVDNNAATSRLKWYFHTPHTTFASVREIMTLGGRIDEVDGGLLDDIRSLICATTGVPSDFPEDADVPAAPYWNSSRLAAFGDLAKMLSGYLYYFDIAPGSCLPEVKLFIPVRYYASNDLALGRGLTGWMRARGRGDFCERYLRMLERLSEHRRLQDSNGLQAYVSCMVKKGELDITTYLASEAFHPERVEQWEVSLTS